VILEGYHHPLHLLPRLIWSRGGINFHPPIGLVNRFGVFRPLSPGVLMDGGLLAHILRRSRGSFHSCRPPLLSWLLLLPIQRVPSFRRQCLFVPIFPYLFHWRYRRSLPGFWGFPPLSHFFHFFFGTRKLWLCAGLESFSRLEGFPSLNQRHWSLFGEGLGMFPCSVFFPGVFPQESWIGDL